MPIEFWAPIGTFGKQAKEFNIQSKRLGLDKIPHNFVAAFPETIQ